MVTGAVGAATMTGAGLAAVSSEPDTTSVVDMGDEGLSNGDVIDPYLDEFFTDGVEVRVPEGEYDWNGDGFSGASADAAIVGQGEVILNNVAGSYTPRIHVTSGTVAVKNFTLRGESGPDKSRFRLEAESGGSVLIDNFNLPDGSSDNAESKAFYVPREHAGVVEIRNCYVRGFSDNGIYASSPAYEGNGQVIVENTVTHNVNIAGIRVGSGDSIVRNCLVINDDEAPPQGGDVYQRGIRVREPGDNITIEGCEVIHSYDGAGPPIEIHDGAEGGSGQVVDTEIRNNSSSPAIHEKGSGAAEWTADTVSIVGEGSMEYPPQFEGVCVGEDCTAPSGDDPQADSSTDATSGDTTGDSSSGDDTSGGSSTTEHTFIVNTVSGSGVIYEFTATGPVQQVDVENNDVVTDNGDGTYSVTGETGNGYADEFTVTGELTSWSAEQHPDTSSGEYSLTLDGTSLDPATIGATGDSSTDDSTGDGSSGDSTDDDSTTDDSTSDGSTSDGSTTDDSTSDSGGADADTLNKKMVVDGTRSDGASLYSFTVSGSVEPSADLSTAPEDGDSWDELEDKVDGNTVSGIVGKGLDGYRYSGYLTALEIDGEVEITNESSS
jgi:hypothetical protein